MKPVSITIPHALGKDEALRRLKTGLTQSAAAIPLLHIAESAWAADRMTFRATVLGQTVTGTVDVEDTLVRVEVLLPALLSRLANTITEGLAAKGRLLLTKR